MTNIISTQQVSVNSIADLENLLESDNNTLGNDGIPVEVPTIDNQNPVRENSARELPTNSPYILDSGFTSRFKSAIWFDKVKNIEVSLIGLGGIGSYVGFLLSRVRPAVITMYDNDVIEENNISGQLYFINKLGLKKGTILEDIMKDFSNYYNIMYYDTECYEVPSNAKVVICGLDNMRSRSSIFKSWVNNVTNSIDKKEFLFIDGRLAAEEFQVFCIRGDDEYSINKYAEQYLFSDEEAEETICSYKQTSFMATMIASVIVNLFINFVSNKCNPIIDRSLPFYTSYNAETMFYKTII